MWRRVVLIEYLREMSNMVLRNGISLRAKPPCASDSV